MARVVVERAARVKGGLGVAVSVVVVRVVDWGVVVVRVVEDWGAMERAVMVKEEEG